METDTHRETSPYPAANQLAREIFHGVWPHPEGLADRTTSRDREIPEDCRVPVVTDATPLEPGDLVVINESSYYPNRLPMLTARESIELDTLAVVVKATDKTVTVRNIRKPSWSDDLDELGSLPGPEYRVAKVSVRKDIGRLGKTLEQLQELVRAHPRFAAWKAAHEAAKAQCEADLREQVEDRDRAAKAAAPLREASDRLNDILGPNATRVAVYSHNAPKISFGYRMEFLADETHGEVYLHGLAATGRIDADTLTRALDDLRTIALANAAR